MKTIEFAPTKEQQAMVGDHQAAGQRFDLMATFQAKDGGKWCLVAIEDSPMPGYKDDEPKKPAQQENKFMETYEKARAGQMEGGQPQGGAY